MSIQQLKAKEKCILKNWMMCNWNRRQWWCANNNTIVYMYIYIYLYGLLMTTSPACLWICLVWVLWVLSVLSLHPSMLLKPSSLYSLTHSLTHSQIGHRNGQKVQHRLQNNLMRGMITWLVWGVYVITGEQETSAKRSLACSIKRTVRCEPMEMTFLRWLSQFVSW